MVSFREFVGLQLVNHGWVALPPPPPVLEPVVVVPGLWTVFRITVVDGITRYTPGVPQWWISRTRLEKVGICGLTVFMVWKAYQNRCADKVWALIKYATPGLRAVRNLWLEPEIVVEGASYFPESVRSGSVEHAMSTPSFQCLVLVDRPDGTRAAKGNAIRFPHNYLVGPDHVLSNDVEKYCKGTQGVVSLRGKERIHLDADLVAIKLGNDEFSKIGLSEARVSLVPRNGMPVQIVNTGTMKGTVAVATPNPMLFGMLRYEGTTVPGYSGAAYQAGNAVVGMHTHGGKTNGGYSASYIYAVLNQLERVRPEDSAEWLNRMYDQGSKIRYKIYGLDEVLVMQDSGRVDLVDRKSIISAFGPDFDNGTGVLRRKRDRRYDDTNPDIEPEAADNETSGEAKSSEPQSGASSKLEQPNVLVDQNLQILMSELRGLSTNRLRSIVSLLKTQKQPENVMPGQAVLNGQPAT